jgi:spore maturation protein CgeB
LRAANRLLSVAHRQEFYRQILYRVASFKPDVVMTYKGHSLEAAFLRRLQALGCPVVNVYPDCSPHAHGNAHNIAVGTYDLVVSTKPFHPALWKSVYGYNNPCVFVPQGYDPRLHLVCDPPTDPRFDITMVATWRPEYGELMKALGKLFAGRGISVGIGGNGWMQRKAFYPSEWVITGGLQGRSYVEWLRQGRICIAPVTRQVVINGVRQPGDEDTTRTYELAAAHCFFIHRRTEFVRCLYSEESEVPMYDTPEELAEKILYYLPREADRQRMALNAHRRAVTSYSLDARASELVVRLSEFLRRKPTPE